jgi:DNA-binding phage protein
VTLFKTTDEQRVQRAVIAVEMKAAGLPTSFIGGWMELSDHDKGAFELGELWVEESDEEERGELEAAIQDLLDEAAELPAEPIEKPRIGFGNLGAVATSILEHKAHLRALIDRDHGGVSAAAAKIGMPQPSLSRFLSSASMPRRTTLYRIAKGLDLDESDIATEWVR